LAPFLKKGFCKSNDTILPGVRELKPFKANCVKTSVWIKGKEHLYYLQR